MHQPGTPGAGEHATAARAPTAARHAARHCIQNLTHNNDKRELTHKTRTRHKKEHTRPTTAPQLPRLGTTPSDDAPPQQLNFLVVGTRQGAYTVESAAIPPVATAFRYPSARLDKGVGAGDAKRRCRAARVEHVQQALQGRHVLE